MSTNLPGNRSIPDCTIIPVLFYEDLEEAIEWLSNTFGFKERWRAGEHRAQLVLGDGAIAITSSGNASTSRLLARVADVNDHFEKAQQRGLIILQPPTDFPYGEKQYSAQCIGGHFWTFSQTIKDVAPEEWGGKTAFIK